MPHSAIHTHYQPNNFARVLAIFALLLLLGMLGWIAVRGRAQWDFNAHYHAALAFRQGLDPYSPESLQRVAPGSALAAYLYPPLILYFYGAFTLLPYRVAYLLWLVLKVAALAGLLSLWHRRFLPLHLDRLTPLYLLVAFNGALLWDIAAGNISLFEQLALWSGFACLLAGKAWLFCLLVILTAQFKLTPVLFLFLLLADKQPPWRLFLASWAGFLGLLSINYWLYPGLSRRYLQEALALDEWGANNPSMLSFVRDALYNLTGGIVSASYPVDEALYLLLVLGVAMLTLRAIQSHVVQTTQSDPRILLFFFCAAYALIVPRMKNYSFILLLVPTLHVLRHSPHTLLVPLAAFFALLPLHLPLKVSTGFLASYISLFAAGIVWYAYLIQIQTRRLN